MLKRGMLLVLALLTISLVSAVTVDINGAVKYQTIIGGGTTYSEGHGDPYPIPIDDAVMQSKALGFPDRQT